MKTILRSLLLIFALAFAFQSCEDQDDVESPASLQVNDFVWKGLNQFYLWQPDVPNLADDRFSNQEALNSFLRNYSSPEDLFQDLLNKPSSKFPKGQAIDRFSWIVEDYSVLEQELQGTTKNDGVDFRLSYKPNSTTELVGYVRYIIPNSNASTKDIKRGDLFTGVNGTKLTVSNYQSLLNADSYALNMASFNGTSIEPNGKTVSLTKTTLDENPILINKVLVEGSHTIGYLMYNGFYANYDTQLNNAINSLKDQAKAQNKVLTDFVLDLRYNGGGSIQTASRLASMIVGTENYKGKIFAKEQWNPKVNEYYESEDPESLNVRFPEKIGTESINGLNMTKVYIITTDGTASASELVINGLAPYITVVQIGETTVGKNVGSVTLYDSPTFGKTNRNPNHKYAMQPLVLKIVNSVGFGEYTDGLKPTYEKLEVASNMGMLGDRNEPLLNLAIAKITGTGKTVEQDKKEVLKGFTNSKTINGVRNQMYIEKAPEGLLKALQ